MKPAAIKLKAASVNFLTLRALKEEQHHLDF